MLRFSGITQQEDFFRVDPMPCTKTLTTPMQTFSRSSINWKITEVKMETFNSSFVIQKEELGNAMSGFNPQILLKKQLLEDSGQFLWTSQKMELGVLGLVLGRAVLSPMMKLWLTIHLQPKIGIVPSDLALTGQENQKFQDLLLEIKVFPLDTLRLYFMLSNKLCYQITKWIWINI